MARLRALLPDAFGDDIAWEPGPSLVRHGDIARYWNLYPALVRLVAAWVR